MFRKCILIYALIQVSLGKNVESNPKKSRHQYLLDHPGLLPTDVDYSMFPNEPPKPPQKLTDEILSVIHDENTDSQFDETKREKPSRANIIKWFGDVMKKKKSVATTTSIPTSKAPALNCTTHTAKNDLKDIVEYLSKINENLGELKNAVKSNNAYLVVKVPSVRPDKNRFKRDVNATEAENDEKTNNKTDGNTRRFIPDAIEPNDIKSKLLYYLEEAFNEIDRKIEPLNILKNNYSEENNFKVGYIIANIDTLEVNLKNLRDEMEKNKHLWDDKKVLELFDRLKASDNVLSNLLDSLKNYVGMKNTYGV